MIYLIGGAPGAGKSTLAKKIAENFDAKIIELDKKMPEWNLKVPKEQHSIGLPVWQAKKENRNPSVEDYRQEAETYWPFIDELLKQLPATQNWIIEGAQLWPDLIEEYRNTSKIIFIDSETSKDFSKQLKNMAEKVNLPFLDRDTAQSWF